MRTRLLVPVVLLGGLGCANRSASQQTTARSDAVITAEEIAAVSGAASLYDVIRLRRPRWLRPPNPTSVRSELQTGIRVYMDRMEFGGVEALREIHPSAAAEVQYLRPSQAEARFGPGHPNGAIVVITKPGS
jgi:hypothetical protein